MILDQHEPEIRVRAAAGVQRRQTWTAPPPLVPGRPPVARTCSAADSRLELVGLLRAGDPLLIIATGLASYMLRFGTIAPPIAPILLITLAAVLTANCLAGAQAYGLASIAKLRKQMAKVTVAWSASFLALLLLDFCAPEPSAVSRSWMLGWFIAAELALGGSRMAASRQIERWRRQGRYATRIAIVGGGAAAFGLSRRLREAAGSEIELVGVFADRSMPGDVAGKVDDMLQLAGARLVDEILVALPWDKPAELGPTIRKLTTVPVDVRLELGGLPTELPIRGVASLAGIPMLNLQNRPLAGWNLRLKRAEDIALAFLMLLLLAPLMMLIAVLIKLDSRGPVFFRQERFGFSNNTIWVTKFRTMHHSSAPDPSAQQATRNDPRVTRLGAYLRRTSCDELPQLFDVLRGDMSLVGPRPHAVAHNHFYAGMIEGYLARHRMKPGITGWAQVHGLRGETANADLMRRRVAFDIYYVDHWSFLLDLRILFMTLPSVLSGRNAY